MINTPQEAYDNLKPGDLVRDANGDLYRASEWLPANRYNPELWLNHFSDEYAPTITAEGQMSNPAGMKFPLTKMRMEEE